jgi:proteasome assembly chaperone (PAC2) family protein
MPFNLSAQPKLDRPVMIASWPGIGNIGLLATDTLRVQIGAEKLGEIEPQDFFYPKKIVIRDSVLESLEFPASTFYCKKLPINDVVAFIGEEQPTDGSRPFAEGRKAYQMANLVVDAAERLGCRRIYTSGAAVSLSHHALKPRVWIATSSEALNSEMTAYENTILMGRGESRGHGGGTITGLNGLVLGVARTRGLEAVCLMGEIPDYLASAPLPYPKASKSVVELLAKILRTDVDFGQLDEMAGHIDGIIAGIYDNLPADIRERVERRKDIIRRNAEAITAEEEKWMKEHIEDLFKKGDKRDDRAS